MSLSVCAGVNVEIEVLHIGSGAGRSHDAADSIWWNLLVWDIQRFHAHKGFYDMLSGPGSDPGPSTSSHVSQLMCGTFEFLCLLQLLGLNVFYIRATG